MSDKCKRVRTLWVDYLQGRLAPAQRDDVKCHIEQCEVCASEERRLRLVHARIGTLGPRVSRRQTEHLRLPQPSKI